MIPKCTLLHCLTEYDVVHYLSYNKNKKLMDLIVVVILLSSVTVYSSTNCIFQSVFSSVEYETFICYCKEYVLAVVC